MILPQAFDQNEWFILISTIVMYVLALILPKRFPLSITIIVMLFTSTVARLSDQLLSGTIVSNVYDIMDSGKHELFDLVTYVTYGPFGYFLFYLYDLLKPKGIWIVFYILGWSVAAAVFEKVSAFFDVFNYDGWKVTYSFSFYLIVVPVALQFCVYVKKAHERNLRK